MWCKYTILRNLAVYHAMLTNTSGLFCIPLASLRETPRDNRIRHDVGLRSAGKLRFLSNGPYSRHEVTTDFLAAIFARISAIRARNGINRARKRGVITRNTVEIPRVLARSRAHFHTGTEYTLAASNYKHEYEPYDSYSTGYNSWDSSLVY